MDDYDFDGIRRPGGHPGRRFDVAEGLRRWIEGNIASDVFPLPIVAWMRLLERLMPRHVVEDMMPGALKGVDKTLTPLVHRYLKETGKDASDRGLTLLTLLHLQKACALCLFCQQEVPRDLAAWSLEEWKGLFRSLYPFDQLKNAVERFDSSYLTPLLEEGIISRGDLERGDVISRADYENWLEEQARMQYDSQRHALGPA